jgi:hypothetical protein
VWLYRAGYLYRAEWFIFAQGRAVTLAAA